MAAITLSDMKSKLVTVDDLARSLQVTEPVSAETIDSTRRAKFRLDPDWATDLDHLDATDPVNVFMTVEGTERQFTKEAVVQAAANFGLTGAYIKSIPSKYVEGLLNYHYGNGMGSKSFSVLTVADRLSAFTRPHLKPFSNLQLLENVVKGIQAKYGKSTPIYSDYKFANSFTRTDMRLIVPAQERIMHGTAMPDVPENGEDVWFAGIHLSNSLIGKTQTSLEAYLFRWWCTNGATTTLDGIGRWDRRTGGQDEEDVYEWARASVDEVLGGLESRFDAVQALSALNIAGNTSDILREIFEENSVPVSQREHVMNTLLESENLTLYTVMNAITQAANLDDLDDRRRDRLMRIGGALPTKMFDTLKARVWDEGHSAGERANNPYRLQPING